MNTKEKGKSKHWVAGDKICFPKEEGGVEFRDLFDISKAMFAKLWCSFRTSRSLWTDYMWIKYCKKLIPTIVQWRSGSQVGKKMLEARDAIEQEIWWEPTVRSSNIWFDNWTRLGVLYYVVDPAFPINEKFGDIDSLMTEEKWDVQKIQGIIPDDIV